MRRIVTIRRVNVLPVFLYQDSDKLGLLLIPVFLGWGAASGRSSGLLGLQGVEMASVYIWNKLTGVKTIGLPALSRHSAVEKFLT